MNELSARDFSTRSDKPYRVDKGPQALEYLVEGTEPLRETVVREPPLWSYHTRATFYLSMIIILFLVGICILFSACLYSIDRKLSTLASPTAAATGAANYGSVALSSELSPIL
jgi:hypothetical protein